MERLNYRLIKMSYPAYIYNFEFVFHPRNTICKPLHTNPSKTYQIIRECNNLIPKACIISWSMICSAVHMSPIDTTEKPGL